MIGSLALGAGVITDISIATALCYYLQQLRTDFSRSISHFFVFITKFSNRSGIFRSNALVRSLTVHAVDTGILTRLGARIENLTTN